MTSTVSAEARRLRTRPKARAILSKSNLRTPHAAALSLPEFQRNPAAENSCARQAPKTAMNSALTRTTPIDRPARGSGRRAEAVLANYNLREYTPVFSGLSPWRVQPADSECLA